LTFGILGTTDAEANCDRNIDQRLRMVRVLEYLDLDFERTNPTE
jgi:hypothetical protein